MENRKSISLLPPIRELFREFEKSLGFKTDVKWSNTIAIFLYHIIGSYWCYHYAFPVKWQTLVFAAVTYIVFGFGITCGVHRLWAHKSYKANVPLKILLLLCYAGAGQNALDQWVRDHRLHHKYSDTDADPHNPTRGFFFSHIGWLMLRKHEQARMRAKQIDLSDITGDPLLKIYQKYFIYLKLMFCYFLPTTLNVYLLKEDWKCAVAWHCFIRFLGLFHSELSVNSFAHAYGYKPYNKTIVPTQNRFVATCTFGEGWHNYHHVFPFDYKAAEHFDVLNFSTIFINFFNTIGWAYDLHEATPKMIKSISNRLGDNAAVHNIIE